MKMKTVSINAESNIDIDDKPGETPKVRNEKINSAKNKTTKNLSLNI
jgi:hypothetical protein